VHEEKQGEEKNGWKNKSSSIAATGSTGALVSGFRLDNLRPVAKALEQTPTEAKLSNAILPPPVNPFSP